MATIDFLILATHVQIADGKLYMHGGGWTDLYRPKLEKEVYLNTFGAALSVCIRQEEAEKFHVIRIAVEKKTDGQVLATTSTSRFSLGSAAFLLAGLDEQHVLCAATFNLMFPSPGPYRVTAAVGEERTQCDFQVHERV